jgi:hypothetical protein
LILGLGSVDGFISSQLGIYPGSAIAAVRLVDASSEIARRHTILTTNSCVGARLVIRGIIIPPNVLIYYAVTEGVDMLKQIVQRKLDFVESDV